MFCLYSGMQKHYPDLVKQGRLNVLDVIYCFFVFDALCICTLVKFLCRHHFLFIVFLPWKYIKHCAYEARMTLMCNWSHGGQQLDTDYIQFFECLSKRHCLILGCKAMISLCGSDLWKSHSPFLFHVPCTLFAFTVLSLSRQSKFLLQSSKRCHFILHFMFSLKKI